MNDLKDKRFDILTAIKPAGKRGSCVTWECLCDCGNVKVMASRDLPRMKSCGNCKQHPVQMGAIDAAWSAGFFDGEGCISIRHKMRKRNVGGWFQLSIQVVNTHLGALERLKALFGFGTLHKKKVVEGRRQCYVWILTDRAAERFLLTIRPYLLVKSGQADAALRFRQLGQRKPYEKVSVEVYEEMQELAERIRTLNGNTYRKALVNKVTSVDYVESVST